MVRKRNSVKLFFSIWNKHAPSHLEKLSPFHRFEQFGVSLSAISLFAVSETPFLFDAACNSPFPRLITWYSICMISIVLTIVSWFFNCLSFTFPFVAFRLKSRSPVGPYFFSRGRVIFFSQMHREGTTLSLRFSNTFSRKTIILESWNLIPETSIWLFVALVATCGRNFALTSRSIDVVNEPKFRLVQTSNTVTAEAVCAVIWSRSFVKIGNQNLKNHPL